MTLAKSLLIASAMAVAAAPSLSQAATHTDVFTKLLRDGNNAGNAPKYSDGRARAARQVGAGGEQASIVQFTDGTINIFEMGSYEINGSLPPNRIQMLCMSMTWDQTQGPVMNSAIAPGQMHEGMVYVTNNDGDRYRNANHIAAKSIFGGEAALVLYNYAPNNHAYRYGQVFGPNCEPLSERTRLMAKNNDNCSENEGQPTVVGETTEMVRMVEGAGCNGNGRDDSWIVGFNIQKTPGGQYAYAVEKEYDFSIEANEERSRIQVEKLPGEEAAVAFWTAGNTQPPNRGVRIGKFSTAQGVSANDRLMWRQYLMRRENGIYRTQLHMAPVRDAQGNATDTFYVTYTESNSRRRRGKGGQTLKAATVQIGTDGFEIMGEIQSDVFPTGDPTHGSVFSTLWGVDGQEQSRALILSSSVNGNTASQATLQVVEFNSTERSLGNGQRISTNAAIDNAWISNIYGQKPHTQGRNFIQGITVVNPNYGTPGAFMSDVKTFVAIAANTRRMDANNPGYAEDKLATELVMVPAIVAAEEEDPLPQDPQDPDPQDPQDPQDPADPSDPTAGNGIGGCSTSGSTGGLATLLGFALVLGFRRRRNS